MKIRNGFVSNSSSSSFIISSEMHIEPEITIKIPMKNLGAYCITNTESLIKYFIKNYGLEYSSENESFEEILDINGLTYKYQLCLDELNNEKAIWCFEVSSDEEEHSMLYGKKLPKSDTYIVISEE